MNSLTEKLSIVLSVYNEEDGLLRLSEELLEVLKKLNLEYELIFVNDGSSDRSGEIIRELQRGSSRIKSIHFSRNFGHEAAMVAGIDHSSGSVIICMDADLQHPPSKIPEMIKKHQEGYEIINMIRKERKDGGWLKRISTAFFYKLINKISPVHFEKNASDFFLISRRVSLLLKDNYRERTRFLRGYIQLVGFPKTTLEYVADARQDGKSKYSLYRLFILSLGAVVSFSKLPLHLGIVVGIVFGFFSLVVGAYSIFMNFIGETPPGYTTLVVFMSFSFSILFFLIGIIGVYIGYNFEENKKRPIYIIQDKSGFEED